LNPNGIQQAQATAHRLAQWQPAKVYYSPLRRTVHTAQLISLALSCPLSAMEELIDIDYGQWQGLSPQEAASKDGDLYQRWLNSPHLVEVPGGEGLEEVRTRAEEVIAHIMENHPNETAVVVSHKAVCQILVLALLSLDNSRFWQVSQDVAAINLFELRQPYPAVMIINDTCHLKEAS
ncbi:MAG: histidine phosphatase family protein, partial [Dehalococcoidia bacterium]|nr:histidine phosphatase family protein [Dehalococcoidia bacterium]